MEDSVNGEGEENAVWNEEVDEIEPENMCFSWLHVRRELGMYK